ncbi:site-specific DNA-methyltransferase [Sporosarcina sp. BI001-red]|uniref:site-specific DNA-methyltransferase n=1 Tax=Sporosarcina sp. BI001-red TaxID=2282866 RepID=UPI000E2230FE|nr:site-specific DNA-methyltransferase [Sporosarcina sp. BI001-red]REB11150.1 site-specific DNA-methyltransferase [Sporosarcina sp. BI001-red]
MSIEELKRPDRTDEERVRILKELFPEAFSDGQINVETIKELVNAMQSDTVETDYGEFFGLQWVGKKQARKLASVPSTGTLRKVVGDGINEDETNNILIEGDNLEVLRILQKSYAGRIQTIYIDPPYNTDNDYIYKDTFKEPVESYLHKSKQADDDGLLTSNPKASGRYHANWLNMMYPRLKIAWSLLKKDGVICVSISDIEEANLRKVLDEIFGEENHINTISVKSKVNAGASGGGEDKRLKKNLEYIHIYAKSIDELSPLANLYQNENLMDLISEMREQEQSWKYTSVLTDMGTRKKLTTTYDGKGNAIDVYLRENVKRTTVNQLMKSEGLSEEEVYKKYLDRIFSDTNAQSSIRTRVIDASGVLESGNMFEVEYTPRSGRMRGEMVKHHYISNSVRRVIWLNDVVDEIDGTLFKKERLSTLWDDIDYNNVGKEGGISFPNGKKPIELIQRCIKINDNSNKDGIVLDFFAGSGSTGHAVLDMNSKDSGNRKFILVQLPETPKGSAYHTITELTKQRLKNSIHTLEKSENNAGEPVFGFEFYQMSKTNIKKWNDKDSINMDDLYKNLDLFMTNPLDDDESEINIVIELMLNQGFPLDSMITKKEDSGNKLLIVRHEDVPFSLVICLDEKLVDETEEYLKAYYEKSTFICIDDSLSNKQKVLLSEMMNVKTI